MTIRDADMNDLAVLTEMNIGLRKDEMIDNVMTDEEVMDRMKGFITGKAYRMFMMTDGDNPAGYILVDITKRPFYLRQLYVKEVYRSKGLGSFFIDRTMELLNAHQIDVEVMVWNEKAVRFYEKYGFKKRYLGLRYKKY